jgi:predicted MFS family arabinose efflux permease
VVGILILLATIGGIIFTRAPTWPVLLTGRVLTAPASASC